MDQDRRRARSSQNQVRESYLPTTDEYHSHLINGEIFCYLYAGVCGLAADKGPCLALIPRWYFNSNSGKCELFMYGGCLGNANNFASKVKCQNTCNRGERNKR